MYHVSAALITHMHPQYLSPCRSTAVAGSFLHRSSKPFLAHTPRLFSCLACSTSVLVRCGAVCVTGVLTCSAVLYGQSTLRKKQENHTNLDILAEKQADLDVSWHNSITAGS